MATRRELTKKYARTYQQASKKQKGQMLDELCHATEWSRSNARRAIRDALSRTGPASARRRKPRARKYSFDALEVLTKVWTLAGEPCGKYLAPVMADTLERLVRFKELGDVKHRLTDSVRDEAASMSAATIDRYLSPVKKARYPEAKSTTSPSHILRSSIPIRTAIDGFPKETGYLEIDTVAHCGSSTKGDYLVTICATDPFTGWTILKTVKNKAFIHMKAGMGTRMDADRPHRLAAWPGEPEPDPEDTPPPVNLADRYDDFVTYILWWVERRRALEDRYYTIITQTADQTDRRPS